MDDDVNDDAIRAAGGATKADLANLHQKLNQRDAALAEMQRRLGEVTNRLSEAEVARRLSNLPEDEAAVERIKIEKERAEAKVSELERRVAEGTSLMDKFGRVRAAEEIGKKYEVDFELLLGAATPEAMEMQAKKIRDKTTQQNLDVEAKVKEALAKAGIKTPDDDSEPTPADDGGGGGTPPKYDPAKFEHTGNIAGALIAKRKAGLTK